MSGFFGGGSDTQTVTNQTKLPDWVDKGAEAMFGAGGGLASRPYPTYPGPRVAPLNSDQQAAFDLVRNSQGEWQPSWNAAQDLTGAGANLVGSGANLVNRGAGYLGGANRMIDQAGNYIGAAGQKVGAAQGYTDTAGTPVNANDINAYMDPYNESVINSVIQKMNQQFGRQKIDQTAALTARGSRLNEDRRGIIEGVNQDNFNNTLGGIIAQLQSSGFGNALAQANATKGQALAAGGQTGNLASLLGSLGGQTGALAGQRAGLGTASGQLGGQLNAMGGQMGALGGQEASLATLLPSLRGIDINQLRGIGGQQQQQTQTNLNLANQDFLNQFNYPQQQLDWLNGLLRGSPYSTTSTQTSPVGTANPWAQALGLLGTGVGAAGSFGLFG